MMVTVTFVIRGEILVVVIELEIGVAIEIVTIT